MEKFVNNEPISRFLIWRMNFTPWKAYMFLILAFFVFEIIPGKVLDLTTISQNYLGVFQDYYALALGLIIVPSSWAFFIWLPLTVNKNLDTLCESNIIQEKDQPVYHKIIDQVMGVTGKKCYMVFSIILSIVITYLAQITTGQYTPIGWSYTIPIYNYIVIVPKMALNFYIFVQFGLWTIVLIFLLNKIFSSVSINLIPYHHDNASGLGVVGEFSFGIGKISLIMGLFIIGEIITAITRGQGLNQPNIILEVIAFPLLTLFLFFAPLISCHNAMVKAKKEILQNVGNKIQDAMIRINNSDEPSVNDFNDFNSLVSYQQQLGEDIHIQ